MTLIKILVLILGVLLFLVSLASNISYLASPMDYRFGTAVNGFTYKSGMHYLGVNFFILIMSCLCIYLAIKNKVLNSFVALVLGIIALYI